MKRMIFERRSRLIALAALVSALTGSAAAEPQAGSLVAAVIDEVTGLAIPSASVRISDLNGTFLGEFPARTVVALVQGNYMLTPAAPGYLFSGTPARIVITVGPSRPEELRLSPPATLTGRVIDADFRAVK